VIQREENISCFYSMGTRVDVVQIPKVILCMEEWINESVSCRYICISNMNDVVWGQKDSRVKLATNGAALSVPDGMSLVQVGRLNGFQIPDRVYGPDLMKEFFSVTAHKTYRHYFYGGNENTLKHLVQNIQKKYPGINLVGSYSPPFRELTDLEKKDVICRINEVKPDIVWIGLGCPKQQLWMHEFSPSLKASAMVGVGAAFDFLAGMKRQAPRWMQKNGLEWLFRVCSEPKRLWRRYLAHGSAFVFGSMKEIMKHKKHKGISKYER